MVYWIEDFRRIVVVDVVVGRAKTGRKEEAIITTISQSCMQSKIIIIIIISATMYNKNEGLKL